ncbi:MAG: hypothetical protein ACI8RD_010298 [Bacillariaceae sp.]|jgi:hypothetical protein
MFISLCTYRYFRKFNLNLYVYFFHFYCTSSFAVHDLITQVVSNTAYVTLHTHTLKYTVGPTDIILVPMHFIISRYKKAKGFSIICRLTHKKSRREAGATRFSFSTSSFTSHYTRVRLSPRSYCTTINT